MMNPWLKARGNGFTLNKNLLPLAFSQGIRRHETIYSPYPAHRQLVLAV